MISSLVHTLSSITSLEDVEIGDNEEDEEEGEPLEEQRSTSICSSTSNLLKPTDHEMRHRSAPATSEGEPGDQLQSFRVRVHSLERKMHEQAMLVADLANCRASELKLETERRKLRQLEQLYFAEFRRSMAAKLKFGGQAKQRPKAQKGARTHREASRNKMQKSPRNLFALSFDKESSPISSNGGTPRKLPSTADMIVTEHVDMNIDVQVGKIL